MRAMLCRECRWTGLLILILVSAGLFCPPVTVADEGEGGGQGTLTGTVVDARDHSPLPGANVTIQGDNVTLSALTDEGGNFSFPSLPPGNYTLKVLKEGYLPLLTRLNLSTRTTNITIPLSRYPPPTLYGGRVERVGEGYLFSVIYMDLQGRPPQNMEVVVDGIRHPMALSGGNFTGGATYSVTLKLDPGIHTYYFRATGPEGESLIPLDSTPHSEMNQRTLRVVKEAGWGLTLLLSVSSIIIAASVTLLLLRRPGGGAGREE